MKPTDKTLSEQMKIHDAEVYYRKELINFSRKDAELLLNCQVFIQARIDDIVLIFYEKQTSFEEIALIIGISSSI